jgi:aminoglycoside phosphotransferase (APT) family kinase protein
VADGTKGLSGVADWRPGCCAAGGRLPDAAVLAERYTRAAGRELAHLDFYLGLGYFKIAVIAEGIHARHRRGMTRGSGFDQVGDAVGPLAAAGLRAVSNGL